MPAHFEVRTSKGRKQEWLAIVGGNNETMMTTETYSSGHGNAQSAVKDVIAAVEQAKTQPIVYKVVD